MHEPCVKRRHPLSSAGLHGCATSTNARDADLIHYTMGASEKDEEEAIRKARGRGRHSGLRAHRLLATRQGNCGRCPPAAEELKVEMKRQDYGTGQPWNMRSTRKIQ